MNVSAEESLVDASFEERVSTSIALVRTYEALGDFSSALESLKKTMHDPELAKFDWMNGHVIEEWCCLMPMMHRSEQGLRELEECFPETPTHPHSNDFLLERFAIARPQTTR